MIHHISIAAHQPQHVSEVLAEVLLGQSLPFPEHPGSYLALALDDQGTMIEVYPFGTALLPGLATNGAVQFQPNSQISPYVANHAAISVPANAEQIQAIADREGWRLAHCNRGGYFEVLEFWVENQLLIELLPPDFVTKYLAFMEPRSLLQAAQVVAP
jgi:hypothetical protein